MKRSFKVILTLVLALSVLLSLCGCYVVKSGKMSKVEGTYLLTYYSAGEDMLAKDGITLYIVIESDGSGYYAYSDNDTEAYYSEMSCRFTQDTEKSGYYSYVELQFEENGDWHKLGVNSRWRDRKLNSSVPKYKGSILNGTLEIDYYTSVTFERVSGKTDMSYIENKLGELSHK